MPSIELSGLLHWAEDYKQTNTALLVSVKRGPVAPLDEESEVLKFVLVL